MEIRSLMMVNLQVVNTCHIFLKKKSLDFYLAFFPGTQGRVLGD